MPSLRQIRRKISSVKGTQRIMKAMKLISAVKLQRAQGLLQAFRPYSDSFDEIARNLATRCDPELHPLLRRPEERKKLNLVFMTSDRGLCGSFNSNLIRRIETYISVDAKAYEQVTFMFIGRRGRDYFLRRKAPSRKDYIYEPGRSEVLKFVLPKFIEVRLERAMLESITSEHAARMAAMENATRNAEDVMRRLTLLFNKTRQAIITKELMDIVNGTEALRTGGME